MSLRRPAISHEQQTDRGVVRGAGLKGTKGLSKERGPRLCGKVYVAFTLLRRPNADPA